MQYSSYHLLKTLKSLGYLQTNRDDLWWPNSGTFEVIVGALLTQQSRWTKVEESIENLRSANLYSLHALATVDEEKLKELIRPSGFYNTKAHRVKTICSNIIEEFDSFENFSKYVSREWLLDQKGIGMESADSILCYGCYRDTFVVDSYTGRLLGALGYRFDSYTQIQEWVVSGITSNLIQIQDIYGYPVEISTIYARLHGKIVEYAKDHIRGKNVDITPIVSHKLWQK